MPDADYGRLWGYVLAYGFCSLRAEKKVKISHFLNNKPSTSLTKWPYRYSHNTLKYNFNFILTYAFLYLWPHLSWIKWWATEPHKWYFFKNGPVFCSCSKLLPFSKSSPWHLYTPLEWIVSHLSAAKRSKGMSYESKCYLYNHLNIQTVIVFEFVARV